jgi:hypothetical protein
MCATSPHNCAFSASHKRHTLQDLLGREDFLGCMATDLTLNCSLSEATAPPGNPRPEEALRPAGPTTDERDSRASRGARRADPGSATAVALGRGHRLPTHRCARNTSTWPSVRFRLHEIVKIRVKSASCVLSLAGARRPAVTASVPLGGVS